MGVLGVLGGCGDDADGGVAPGRDAGSSTRDAGAFGEDPDGVPGMDAATSPDQEGIEDGGVRVADGSPGPDAGVEPDAGTDPDAGVALDAAPIDAPMTGEVCVGEPNGTRCGSSQICVDDVCVTSRCGDGVVDPTRGEQCEDGNRVEGDGCDNDCRYSCARDAECDDADPCNGPETCNPTTHRCEDGPPPAGNPPCTRAGGAAGICAGGTCVEAGCGNLIVEPAEQCDDGQNGNDDDGCRDDCTFTCEVNGDCSDGNPCNGEETCVLATHTCRPGTTLSCDDSNGCTRDACIPSAPDPRTACRNTLIDSDGDGYAPGTCPPGTNGGDCDDNDRDRNPGVAEVCDSIDNDCDGRVDEGLRTMRCLRDIDGDGFGDPGVTVTSCACPPGYIPPRRDGRTDCFDSTDGGAAVHPDQTAYFQDPYCTLRGPGGRCLAPRFDYNCDTREEQRFVLTRCIFFGAGCIGTAWLDGTVPDCGDPEEEFATCTSLPTGGCQSTNSMRRQQCR